MHVDASPNSEAARLAVSVYSDVLDAIRADSLIARRVSLEGDTLRIDELALDLSRFDRILVVGAGKAATGMAQGLETVLGSRIAAGTVVTKTGHFGPTGRIRVLEAAHPIPDGSSVEAGRAIHALAESAGERDLVLCLLSGGASSLMELPQDPVTLADLRATTDLLLRAGAPILDLNAVRACLSRLKAGGLARAAAPAMVVCLVLSDVLGSPLEVIGSGPCVDIAPNPQRALAILEQYGLLNQTPPAVLNLLRADLTPSQHATVNAEHFILADIYTALDAARHSARRHGLTPVILTRWLEGEAREVGRVVGALARDLPRTAQTSGFDCLILGGETTVTVRGYGNGGRSQEIACAALESLANVDDVAVLAGSTDGTDGPTDAAGALAEQAVFQRAAGLGLDRSAALRHNDTYPFLQSAGGLIKTGPTHSNVGDIVIITYCASDR
jgi:glycerate 2-kinase